MTGETLNSIEQQTEYHKNKPWIVVMTYDPETSKYMVILPDFASATAAASRVDAVAMAEECLEATIRIYLEEGIPIPEVQVRQPEEFLSAQT